LRSHYAAELVQPLCCRTCAATMLQISLALMGHMHTWASPLTQNIQAGGRSTRTAPTPFSNQIT
jgi:hypothetical protein